MSLQGLRPPLPCTCVCCYVAKPHPHAHLRATVLSPDTEAVVRQVVRTRAQSLVCAVAGGFPALLVRVNPAALRSKVDGSPVTAVKFCRWTRHSTHQDRPRIDPSLSHHHKGCVHRCASEVRCQHDDRRSPCTCKRTHTLGVMDRHELGSHVPMPGMTTSPGCFRIAARSIPPRRPGRPEP